MVNLFSADTNLTELEFNDILCNCSNTIHSKFDCLGAKN